MADLATHFGTEKDRVNCSFYFKIGACRHGDRCSRVHTRPLFSVTVLLRNMYHRPMPNPYGPPPTREDQQRHFDEFYEDVFLEMINFGEVVEMIVCNNDGEHMIGNTYVKFLKEEHAAAAVQALNGRLYFGRPIMAELSPVTDFREARCRQYEMDECTRGGFCNFMHLHVPSRKLLKGLFSYQRKQKHPDSPSHRHHHDDRRDDRRDDRYRDEPRRDDRYRDEPRRDDRYRDEPRRDDRYRDEPRRDDRPRDERHHHHHHHSSSSSSRDDAAFGRDRAPDYDTRDHPRDYERDAPAPAAAAAAAPPPGAVDEYFARPERQ